MCASSKTKLGNESVYIFMGYNLGRLSIGNTTYYECEGKREEKSCSRQEMTEKLCSYKKEDLAKMIVGLIDNCVEA